jgi:hypothetical protein
MAASFFTVTLGVSRAGGAPHAAGHTGHPGPRTLAGPDLFGFSGVPAPENPNKSRALARKPGISGIRFGLNDGTSRQSADYATEKVRRSGESHLFADASYLAPMAHRWPTIMEQPPTPPVARRPSPVARHGHTGRKGSIRAAYPCRPLAGHARRGENGHADRETPCPGPAATPGTAARVQQGPSLFHAPDAPPGTSS